MRLPLAALAVALLGLGAVAGPGASPASADTTASAAPLVTAHPWAENASAIANAAAKGSGAGIEDLAVADGRLYTGYGDYDRNVGPIDLNSFDLATGAMRTELTLDGEEINTLRIIDGSVYAPDIDPRTPWTSPAGYATNAGGTWRYAAATPFIHVYDIAKAGGRLFLAGSIVNPDPALYGPSPWLAAITSSADGGLTWRIEKARASAHQTAEFDRYYWMQAIGDSLYASAALWDDGANTIVDVWRNGSWSTQQTHAWNLHGVYAGSDAVAVGPVIVGVDGRYHDTNAKGGGRNKTQPLNFATGLPGRLEDFFQTGGRTYAIGRVRDAGGSAVPSRAAVSTTTDGRAWRAILELELPAGVEALSLAVDGSRVLVGGSDGRVYAAEAPAGAL